MKDYQLLPQHYLDIARQANHPYYTGFINAFEGLFNKLPAKQQKILEQKLHLIEQKQFNEGKFVQIACETVVCAHFANLYPKNFRYEHQSSVVSKKDVDCQFADGKYTYNIEVKCPRIETYIEKVHGMPKIELKGRFDEKGRGLVSFIENALHETMDKQQTGWNYSLQKRLDNTLKTFLQEAHSKFPIVELTDQVNVLVVCCDDEYDMSRWYDYLYQAQGLFTDDSFADPKTYNRVDLIVLTNLFNRHYSFLEKRTHASSWALNNAFSLAFINPLKLSNYKMIAAKNFLRTFSNYTSRFDYYREELQEHFSGVDISPELAFPILHFIPKLEEELSDGRDKESRFFARWL